MTFQVGDESEAYRTTVVLRVIDIFGDYAELRFYVIVSVRSINYGKLFEVERKNASVLHTSNFIF